MTLKFIAFLLILFPFVGRSQIKSSFDLTMGIEHSYRKLTGGTEEFMQKRDDKETGKMNWRFGFNYNRRLSDKFFLKTGARLASVGFEDGKRIFSSPSDGTGGWTPGPTLMMHEYQEINDFWFIEIPIIARYEFGNKRLIPFIEAGISPYIYVLTKNKVIVDGDEHTDYKSGDEHQDISNLQVVPSISLGLNYNASKKVQIFVQPVFRYHLTSLYDTETKEHLYNYGVEIGLRKKLK